MRKRVLWVDDEIEYLRSHVELLETRGYSVTPVSGGGEAIQMIKEGGCDAYDIVLLDKQMPIKSGGATLEEIRAHCPDLPIIILTGCQHGDDGALKTNYDGCISKPVDPNQLLRVCKDVIESSQRTPRRLTDRYFREYTETRARMGGIMNAADRINLYSTLTEWDICLDGIDNEGVHQAHLGLKHDCGKEFCGFVIENYADWARGASGRPLMAVDMLSKAVAPELRKGRSVLMVVLSGARLDLFLTVEPELKRNFSTTRARFLSALPTLPAFCMASLASGLYPNAAFELEPSILDGANNADFKHDPAAMERLMRAGLKHTGMEGAETFYINADNARRIKSIIGAVKKPRTFGIAAVDIIAELKAHPPAAVAKPQGEAWLRERMNSWFTTSPILGMMKEACGDSCAVILTSDHGHVFCRRESEIYETPALGASRRCMFSNRVSVDEREVFLLEEPSHFRLPSLGGEIKCIMARENYYFTLPGQTPKKQKPTAFQQGGISLEEMVMPLYIMNTR